MKETAPRQGGWLRRRRVRAPALACLLLVLLGALGFGLVNVWVLGSARDQIRSGAASAPPCQAAVIFGAAVYRDGTLAAVTHDRMETGVALYRAGRVQKLLISGDHGRTDYDEVYPMRAFAVSRGVPPQDVFMDHAGFSTYDTVARAKRVFGVDSAVLVTQRFHLPRALMVARAHGLHAVGVPADRRGYAGARYMAARESLARVKDFVKCLFRPDPTHLGPQIAITGDGRITLDHLPRDESGMR